MSKNSDLITKALEDVGYDNPDLDYQRGKGWILTHNKQEIILGAGVNDAMRTIASLPDPSVPKIPKAANSETMPEIYQEPIKPVVEVDDFGNPVHSTFGTL